MAARLNNLRIKTTGAEEEATELFTEVMEMEVEEIREDLVEVEEEGVGTQRSLSSLEFLTQDAEPSRTKLVDARNGFNKLSCLVILWTMWHRWTAGARFAFNCYRHWAQLLLCHPG